MLAAAGVGSRRQVERLIEEGRITVDGAVATLGQRVAGTERILVDGRPVRPGEEPARPRVLLYHKPAGEIVSRDDPEGRPSVFDRLPPLRDGRWISVGRLDFNSSGLLLFTNSGELANRLMHPSSGITRTYAVRTRGRLTEAQSERLRTGVLLDDGPARFDVLEDAGGQGSNHWYRVQLHEGRNREVRRMFEAVGVQVSRLIRTAFGGIVLPRTLKEGRHVELDRRAVDALLEKATASDGSHGDAELGRGTSGRKETGRRRDGMIARRSTQSVSGNGNDSRRVHRVVKRIRSRK